MKSNPKLCAYNLLPVVIMLFMVGCEKMDWHLNHNDNHGHLKEAKTYSSEVVQAWINFDLRLLRSNPSILNNFIMLQQWAYSGIALYEAVLPGMPSYQTLVGQLDQMPVMPSSGPGLSYHWPTCANAVFAAMTRNFYSNIPDPDKKSTDSLEAAFNARYRVEVEAATFERSVNFGKAVAQRVYDWAKTDGSLTSHPTYAIPVGPGLWEKTPPGFLDPQNPYWGNNRPLVRGSVAASQLPAPPAFSTHPSSDFFAAVKEVYDLSNVLTADQLQQAIFWRDVPGGGHAHWLAILSQVLKLEGSVAMLDKAILVFTKMGISQSDARISCWKSKYSYNHIRPITYIRSVMGQPAWDSKITTPNHPEYPSAHATFSAAAADVLTREFGDNYSFTDHTYDFLNLPARNYHSFNHAAQDAGDSRVFAGLHYRFSVAAGNKQGSAVTKYMNERVRFKKGG